MDLQQKLHFPRTSLTVERAIIATNRGPVEFDLGPENVLEYRRGAGGVVTALMGLGSHLDLTWIALAMTEGDRLAARNAMFNDRPLYVSVSERLFHIQYVDVPATTYQRYYERVSNQVLWFLQHYLVSPDEVSQLSTILQDDWKEGYCQVNQALAEAICANIGSQGASTLVMLHDYHLYLVAEMIRRSFPRVLIQQFIHIPWPGIRYWQSFLAHTHLQEIYRGLLANDIVGFQTRRDAHNFLEGTQTIFNDAEVDFEDGSILWNHHTTLVRDYPISISVTDERQLLQSEEGKQATEKLRPYLGKQTILRVDRIEPTKNLVQGFRAYQHLLEAHPELHEDVVFLAWLVPSRQTLAKYQQYQEEILETVEQINQQFGTATWTPIQVIIENDRTQALAAMQFYDVLLVNPWIDGMNLVAKEGVVVNQNNGVVVLSRTAGAFQQLGKAVVPTSPADVVETAEALYTALTLPPQERRRKALLARQIVERNDLGKWLTQQIDDIRSVMRERLQDERDPAREGLWNSTLSY